jgi:hypothetical protein
MLGWILNLWGGAAPGAPPVRKGGGSSHRRGSVWEPNVGLIIEETQRQRVLDEIEAREVELREQHDLEDAAQRDREQSELKDLMQALREYDQKEAEFKARTAALAEQEREAQRYAKFGKRKHPGLMQLEEEREARAALKTWMSSLRDEERETAAALKEALKVWLASQD